MTWLLTDEQLAERHQKFDMDECSSMDNRVDVAKELKISAEIVHNWCENMLSKFMSESNAMNMELLGENNCL